jgi:NTP pyrophosphatase (non-canonical NTP hydrolase)
MTKSEEVLNLLQEECAEVIQAISKVRRFGKEANITDLCKEIGDMLYLVDLAKVHVAEINDFDYSDHRTKKFFKLREFSTLFDDTNYRKGKIPEEGSIPGYLPGAYIIDDGGPVYGIKIECQQSEKN